jgi:oligoendopeptidase F
MKQLVPRSKVKPSDTWDLASLFPNDAAWETAFTAWELRIGEYAQFQGKLAEGPALLAACLAFDLDFERQGERLGTYAMLKTSEDVAQSDYQRMRGRCLNAAGRAAEAGSFIRPEILAIAAPKMKAFLQSDLLAPYSCWRCRRRWPRRPRRSSASSTTPTCGSARSRASGANRSS